MDYEVLDEDGDSLHSFRNAGDFNKYKASLRAQGYIHLINREPGLYKYFVKPKASG